jgi:hypothetical protein
VLDDKETPRLQYEKRVPDRGPTDAEGGHQLPLGRELVARSETPAPDGFLQLRSDMV